jgi:hypothetical protein
VYGRDKDNNPVPTPPEARKDIETSIRHMLTMKAEDQIVYHPGPEPTNGQTIKHEASSMFYYEVDGGLDVCGPPPLVRCYGDVITPKDHTLIGSLVSVTGDRIALEYHYPSSEASDQPTNQSPNLPNYYHEFLRTFKPVKGLGFLPKNTGLREADTQGRGRLAHAPLAREGGGAALPQA